MKSAAHVDQTETTAAPPSRATSPCDACDQTISFDDGWSDNACVGDGRETAPKLLIEPQSLPLYHFNGPPRWWPRSD
jgi:hypothetical protein